MNNPYGDTPALTEPYQQQPKQPPSLAGMAVTAFIALAGLGMLLWTLNTPAPEFGEYDQWLADWFGLTNERAWFLVGVHLGGAVMVVSLIELTIAAVRRHLARRASR